MPIAAIKLADEFWVALVLAGLISPKSAPVESIFSGAMPYVAVMLMVLLLIVIFPSMALALI
jgi:C4-dicarboxylate transporter DctM subunit